MIVKNFTSLKGFILSCSDGIMGMTGIGMDDIQKNVQILYPFYFIGNTDFDVKTNEGRAKKRIFSHAGV